MVRKIRAAILPVIVCAGVSAPAFAQEVIPGSGPEGRPRLLDSDTAALEGGESRNDLNCSVTPDKATLGFDLKFHSGYSVTLPLKNLAGLGNRLTIVFRVTSTGSATPVYFNQHVRVPPIEQTSGDVLLNGAFDLGLGDYHVDWLIRDLAGLYCSTSWDVSAQLSPHDRGVNVALPAHAIAASEQERFQAEPPVARASGDPLNVKVLLNFAPQHPGAATMAPQDRSALVGILRNLARNPRLGRISLIAFNVDQRRILYRQDFSSAIDFPAFGTALKSLALGTVDFHALEDKNGGMVFLSTLIRNEMAADPNVDGLVFVGPRSLLDSSIPEDDLKRIREPAYPIFYLNYEPDPSAVPWRDAIGRMVKFFKGREYTISGPRDLWNAVSETVDRMAQSKRSRLSNAFTGGLNE